MRNKVTIYDVASKAGVSLATVSRVLNNSGKVKEPTKQKVMQVIDELGYRPNEIARGLARRKSTTVGVYVPEITRQSVSQSLQGVMDVSKMYNYSITIENSSPVDDDNFWDSFMAKQVDGILIISDELSEEDIAQFKDSRFKSIVLVSTYSKEDILQVRIDYEAATYEVTKKLIEKGNKKVCLVGGKTSKSINTLKEQGYRKAMEEAELETKFINLPSQYDPKYQEMVKYLDENEVDAIIATRDSIAIACLNAAKELNIDVPNNLEIIGFDNTKYARMSYPQLSSISFSTYDVGAVAMRQLTKVMNDEEITDRTIILPHNFIERGTTK